MTATAKHNSQFPRTIRLACLALLAWTPTALADGGMPDVLPSVPAEAAPASGPAAQSLPAPMLPAVLEHVSRALTLTEVERSILDDVADRVGKYDEPAAFMLLSRVDRIAALNDTEWGALRTVPTEILLDYPQRYRGLPMRMELKAYRVFELLPGRNIAYSSYWDARRPIWRIDAINAAGAVPAEEPIVVFSARDPRPMLGPGQMRTKGDTTYLEYPGGEKLAIAGVFYKVVRDRSRADGPDRDYPMMLAWDLRGDKLDTNIGLRSAANDPLYLLLGAVPVIAVGFFLFRRLRNRKQVGQSMTLGQRARMERRQQEGDEPTVDGPVDPDLARAVEEFKKEHGQGDAQNDKG